MGKEEFGRARARIVESEDTEEQETENVERNWKVREKEDRVGGVTGTPRFQRKTFSHRQFIG